MTEKPRGRPRAYDPDTALWQALETFWGSSFTGTSLDALAAATGMNRPSLYAAFGDKKSLYLKSFDLVASLMKTAIKRTVEAEKPLEAALGDFYNEAISLYRSGPDGARGCFIVCTAPAEAATDGDIRAALAATLKEIDGGLAMLFEKGKAAGDLSPAADATALAQIAASVLHSLAIRARAGASKKELDALAQHTVRMLCRDR